MHSSLVNKEQGVTNPLTGETVVARDVINEFVDSAKFDVLCFLDEQPATPTCVDDHGIVARQTASDYFADFTQRGLLNRVEDTHKHELTYGGQVLYNSIDACFGEITRTQLKSFTRSERPVQLLQSLRTGSATRRELRTRSADSPSNTTIWRNLGEIEKYRWCEARSGRYHLTSAGIRALRIYEELCTIIEQAITKSSFLQRLSTSWTSFPVHALADADLVFSKPASPGLVVDAALELCDLKTREFRILTSVFQPTLFAGYHKLVKLGALLEPIVDASVYEHICQTGDFHYLLDNAKHNRYTLRRLEETLTLGIGLYDDRKVAVGAYNDVGEGNHVAVIISTHDDLVDWGTDVYSNFQQKALPPDSDVQ